MSGPLVKKADAVNKYMTYRDKVLIAKGADRSCRIRIVGVHKVAVSDAAMTCSEAGEDYFVFASYIWLHREWSRIFLNFQ